MRTKVLQITFVVFVAWIAVSSVAAQTLLDLPRQSQGAEVKQRIGLTDISVHYSRPLVNGRKVWGGIVPLGRVWRAGANENTTIEFTDPVTIEGKALPKGTYGLHMIPGEKEWTVIFSKNATAWGSFTYDQAEDALRVPVKPQASDFHEALTYDFDNVKPDSTQVTLRWEKVAVPINVAVDVKGMTAQNLKEQLRGGNRWAWQSWDEAANYIVDSKGDPAQALEYANHSIDLEERFDNLMTKAEVLNALNRTEDANRTKTRALEMASAVQLHNYGRQLQLQGKHEEAFNVFRTNIQRNPGNWLVHSEVARLACAKGDFDSAVKEMKLAVEKAPNDFKSNFQRLTERLQAKEDINK